MQPRRLPTSHSPAHPQPRAGVVLETQDRSSTGGRRGQGEEGRSPRGPRARPAPAPARGARVPACALPQRATATRRCRGPRPVPARAQLPGPRCEVGFPRFSRRGPEAGERPGGPASPAQPIAGHADPRGGGALRGTRGPAGREVCALAPPAGGACPAPVLPQSRAAAWETARRSRQRRRRGSRACRARAGGEEAGGDPGRWAALRTRVSGRAAGPAPFSPR